MKNLRSHLLDPSLYVIHLSFYCILWIHLAQIYAHINIIMRRNYCCHQWMCLASCQGIHWLLGRCQRLWKTSILSNHKIVFDWGGIMNSCSVCDGQISLLWNQCSVLWLANRLMAIEVFGPDFLVRRVLPVGTRLVQRGSGPRETLCWWPAAPPGCSPLRRLPLLPELAPVANE